MAKVCVSEVREEIASLWICYGEFVLTQKIAKLISKRQAIKKGPPLQTMAGGFFTNLLT